MNFKSKYAPLKPRFVDPKIMAFLVIVKSENRLLVLQQINRILTSNLKNLFKMLKISMLTHHTQTAAHRHITLPQIRTINYGLHSYIQNC